MGRPSADILTQAKQYRVNVFFSFSLCSFTGIAVRACQNAARRQGCFTSRVQYQTRIGARRYLYVSDKNDVIGCPWRTAATGPDFLHLSVSNTYQLIPVRSISGFLYFMSMAGQTKADVVSSRDGNGDALLRRMHPYLTLHIF